MLISVGPDQRLGIVTDPYGENYSQAGGLGYPLETAWTVGTERALYDPTNGTISTGNIYYFSGGLSQRDIVTSVTTENDTSGR